MSDGIVARTNLSNLGLLPSGSPAKLVKVNVKPLVDVPVNRIVLVADLLACQSLLQRLFKNTICWDDSCHYDTTDTSSIILWQVWRAKILMQIIYKQLLRSPQRPVTTLYH